MRGAGGKLRALASGHAQALAVQHRPERPGNHDAFFDFDVVNMKRRPFVPRRERSLQFQGRHPVAHHAPQREHSPGMTVPDDEMSHIRLNATSALHAPVIRRRRRVIDCCSEKPTEHLGAAQRLPPKATRRQPIAVSGALRPDHLHVPRVPRPSHRNASRVDQTATASSIQLDAVSAIAECRRQAVAAWNTSSTRRCSRNVQFDRPSILNASRHCLSESGAPTWHRSVAQIVTKRHWC